MKKLPAILLSALAIFGLIGALDTIAAPYPFGVGGTNNTGFATGTVPVSNGTQFVGVPSSTFIQTTTGNWAGTWQNATSGTYYLYSNPLGFVTSTGVFPTTTINGTKALVFKLQGDGSTITSSVSGATTTFSVINPGWITTSTFNATGTAFYFPYWNASGTALSAISSLFISSSTGNVGIGTTSPGQMLTVGNNNQFTVDSSGNVNAAGSIKLGNGITGQALYPYYINSSNYNSIQANGNGDMIFYTGLSTPAIRMAILAGGNTLFGTATDNGGGAKVQVTGGLTTTGNVGIGTTTPAGTLQVVTLSTSTVPLIITATTTPSVDVADFYQGSTKEAVVATGGSIYSRGGYYDGLNTNNYSLTSGGLKLGTSSGLLFTNGANYSNTVDSGLSRYATGTLAVGNGTLGDYSGALIAGNVGIGTNVTTIPLSVSVSGGTSNNIANFTGSGSVSNYVAVRTSGGPAIAMNALTTGARFETINNYPLYFGTNDATQMTLATSGYLGIGTTPASQITTYSITGGTTTAQIGTLGSGSLSGIGFNANNSALSTTNYSVSGDGSRTLINAPAAGSDIDFRLNNVSKMFLNSTGLGIGTSNPSSTLDINGDITDENLISSPFLVTNGTGKLVAGTVLGTANGGTNTTTALGTNAFTSGGLPSIATTSKTIYDNAPTATDDIPFNINMPATTTLKQVECVNDNGAASTFGFNIYWGTTRTATTQSAFTGNQTCTSITTPTVLTPNGSTTIPAGSVLHLVFSAASSSGATVQIEY